MFTPSTSYHYYRSRSLSSKGLPCQRLHSQLLLASDYHANGCTCFRKVQCYHFQRKKRAESFMFSSERFKSSVALLMPHPAYCMEWNSFTIRFLHALRPARARIIQFFSCFFEWFLSFLTFEGISNWILFTSDKFLVLWTW